MQMRESDVSVSVVRERVRERERKRESKQTSTHTKIDRPDLSLCLLGWIEVIN